eukprot:1160660-Pelagomonas_calceolata.AAC.3
MRANLQLFWGQCAGVTRALMRALIRALWCKSLHEGQFAVVLGAVCWSYKSPDEGPDKAKELMGQCEREEIAPCRVCPTQAAKLKY